MTILQDGVSAGQGPRNIFNGMKMKTAYQNLREAARAVLRG